MALKSNLQNQTADLQLVESELPNFLKTKLNLQRLSSYLTRKQYKETNLYFYERYQRLKYAMNEMQRVAEEYLSELQERNEKFLYLTKVNDEGEWIEAVE